MYQNNFIYNSTEKSKNDQNLFNGASLEKISLIKKANLFQEENQKFIYRRKNSLSKTINKTNIKKNNTPAKNMININIQKNIDGNDYQCLKCDKIYNFKLDEKAKHIHECVIPREEYFTKKDVLKNNKFI